MILLKLPINHMKSTTILLTLAASSLASGAITVQSYSHSPGPSSSYPDSGQELTDGIANVLTWGGGNILNSSHIAPFVGWRSTNASTTFTFDTTYNLGSVTVWASDSDGTAGVGLPTTITLTDPNSAFTQAFTVINPAGNGNMLPITMSGFSVTTDQLQVSFVRGSEWTMVTEVSFAAVPEPSTALLISLIPLFAFRRKR